MNRTKHKCTSVLAACSAGWLIILLLVVTTSNYLIYAIDQPGIEKLLAAVPGAEQQDGSPGSGSGFPASGPDEKASSGPVSIAEEYIHEKDPHDPCHSKWKIAFTEPPHQPLLEASNTDLERPPCC